MFRTHPVFAAIISLIALSLNAIQAQTYQTGTRSKQLRTLLVHPINNWRGAPVIALNTDDQLLISFDELSHDYKQYAYRIVHCDRNWKRSNLNALEYLEGFSDNDIETYEQSTTLTQYTHYSLTIPNDKVALKLSGNYALEIYDKDHSKEVLVTTCFSLVEKKTAVQTTVTANTDIDTELEHQQLRLEVTPVGWTFHQPESELSVTIRQNQRRDNEVNNLLPQLISPTRLVYEHANALIFKGGNEYRRFEITTFKYAGIGVNRIAFFSPYYNAELIESTSRKKGYVYDQDQNGRFFIRTTDVTNSETGSDYFLVHFTYPMKKLYLDGSLYLQGDLVENRLDEGSKLIYNFERSVYEKTLFLKQGSYNYHYVFVPSSGNKPTSQPIEGSYWQTENEYQIYVYYRPLGGRYDQLIGFSEFKTTF